MGYGSDPNPHVIELNAVIFGEALYPLEMVVEIVLGIIAPIPNPAGDPPRKGIGLDLGVSFLCFFE